MAYELAPAYSVRAIRVSQYARYNFLGRPEPPFRTGLCFTRDVFFFLSLDSHISEVPRPIAAKLCHMIETWLESRNKVGKFGGPPEKIFRGQKLAKFRSIFCNV